MPFLTPVVSNHFLSRSINSHCPQGSRLDGTRMSPFWILLELRMMEVLVTTGAVRPAMLQSKCHHQQTNTHFYTGWMPFLSPNQQCQSIERKIVSNHYLTRIEFPQRNLTAKLVISKWCKAFNRKRLPKTLTSC